VVAEPVVVAEPEEVVVGDVVVVVAGETVKEAEAMTGSEPTSS
jgi:hypothetical protein